MQYPRCVFLAVVDPGVGSARDAIVVNADGRSFVTVYVETNDLKGTLAKAEKLGARTLMQPTQSGPVEVALFADPEGNVIGLAKGM